MRDRGRSEMAKDYLASAFGGADTVLSEPPVALEGLGTFSLDELVASSGTPVPPNFANENHGYNDDSSAGATAGISNKQLAILLVMHVPLVILWMYSVLGVFERFSIAVRWVGKMCGCSEAEEAFEDDDTETRQAVAGVGGYQHPSRRTQRPLPDDLPFVCVQLPMYNDPFVAKRAIDAACLLRWPRDLLEIQVLDDSDDAATRAIVDSCAATWRERGLMCNVVRRAHRMGFKAGALEHGRKKTAADLITVFDSDCVPPGNYLERVVPHFYGADGRVMGTCWGFPESRHCLPIVQSNYLYTLRKTDTFLSQSQDDMAMVQARWGFLNYDDSALTMAQSMRLEAHRHAGSAVLSKATGCVVGAGAGATWSARAVTAAGGWDATALLESTDLSLRLWCAGYKSKFLANTVVLTELPNNFAAYKGQQERWAQGWAQVSKRHALAVLRMRGAPLWQRWYLFSAVVRESMWPVALVWMLTLPVLIRKGHGWWLGAEHNEHSFVLPRPAALFLYAAPPLLLFAADAVSAAALPPAPPLLMKRSQVAALRLLWLLPYVTVQTGMVVAHAAAFVLGVVSPRVDFARTPKAGGGYYHLRAEPTRVARGSDTGSVQAAAEVILSSSNDTATAAAANGGTRGAEPTTPTKRPAGIPGGHEFETLNRGTQQLPTIPGTPPQPARSSDADTHGDSVSVDNAGPCGVETFSAPFIAAGGAERTRGTASRRWTCFWMELTVVGAMCRLSFAVASADGWRLPAIACLFIAACVLRVACGNWDDEWRHSQTRARSNRFGAPGAGDGESLLEHGGRDCEGYGGLEGGNVSSATMRGGVYDHVRRRQGGNATVGAGDHQFSDPANVPRDPNTRAAIRQYKRYRAKEFDLDNISLRSVDSDAYSAGVSAFGGRGVGDHGNFGGSDLGNESDAGYSETTARSELSAAVFAGAPPVLLTAAQLQTHYLVPPRSTRGHSRPGSEYQTGD